MWSWLTKIDPNTVIAIVVALGTYVYHQIAGGSKAPSFGDQLKAFGRQVLQIVLADPAVSVANVEPLITSELWALATRAGIPRNATTQAIANPIIAELVGEAMAELRKAALPSQQQIDAIVRSISKLPTLDTIPKVLAPASAK